MELGNIAGIGGISHSYVVHGAVARCTEGTDPGRLNLTVSHGVYIKGKPVMTAADNLKEYNFTKFGFCDKSPHPDKLCDYQGCAPWLHTKEDVLIKGSPALLNISTLKCMCGGTISIVHDGQE